ncbi:MAG: hypothetical protein AAF616_01965 [Bacteroidota bacterium]
MKTLYIKFFSLLLLVCLSHVSQGQRYLDTNNPDDDQVKSLLGQGNEINGFGAVDIKVGDLAGERALLVGAYGGFIIDRKYLFGLAGYGIATKVEIEGVNPGDASIKPLDLYGGYAGVFLGISILPKEVVHVSIPILLGAGALEISDGDFFTANPADSEFVVEKSGFFVVEPGMEVEFNLTRHFRLGLGATYRHIAGSNLVNVDDRDLRGFTTVVSFRLGRF